MIKIKILGERNSGKTSLVKILLRVLKALDLNVEIESYNVDAIKNIKFCKETTLTLLQRIEHKTIILDDDSKGEYIICSAIHYNSIRSYEHQPKNIKSGYVICGLRHCNCMVINSSINIGEKIDNDGELSTQGFLTNANKFVDRKEALVIAIAAGQVVIKHNPQDELCSEDLY